MAKFHDSNSIPATGAVAIYTLISTLIAAGWTKVADSDGTTYSSSGVQVTSGAAGTNGLGNANAWVVVRDPAGRREFCFQRTTTNLLWRIKFSEAARFSVGSPSATRVPQGGVMAGGSGVTDEIVLFGSGTDAAPTGATLFDADGTAHRVHCLAQSTADAGGVYYFHLFTTLQSNGQSYTFVICAGLEGCHASDQSPVGVKAVYDNAMSLQRFTSNTVKPWYGWTRYGMASNVIASELTPCFTYIYSNIGSQVQLVPPADGTRALENQNPYDSKYYVYANMLLTNAHGATGSNKHIKGRVRDLAWSAQRASRFYPDTINLATDAWIWTNFSGEGGVVLLRWPESVLPVM